MARGRRARSAAAAGIEMRVVKDDGTSAGAGEVGRSSSAARTCSASTGANPKATRDGFRLGWFDTGDLGASTRAGS